MKRIIIALTALFTLTVSASAMSYEQARDQALFLTDKMAYELNLTEDQYEAAYEINLDYLLSVEDYNDLYGVYWNRRNLDLSYILLDWQYQYYLGASYFYRPLYWEAGFWHFGIYARYPHRSWFYYGRPHFYLTYRGAHSWRMNGGRSWYHGREFGRSHRIATNHHGFGMRNGFDRGDFRNHSGNFARQHNGRHLERSNSGNMHSNRGQNMGGSRSMGSNRNHSGDVNRNGSRSSNMGNSRGSVNENRRSFGQRQSSTRTTVNGSRSSQRSSNDTYHRGSSSSSRGNFSSPSRSFSPNRSSSSSSRSSMRSSSPSRSSMSSSRSSSPSRSFGGGSSHSSGSRSFGGGSSHGGGSHSSGGSHGGGGHFGGHR